MPEKVKHIEVLLSEDELKHLVVILENALVTKAVVPASLSLDARRVQRKAIQALSKLYGWEDEDSGACYG